MTTALAIIALLCSSYVHTDSSGRVLKFTDRIFDPNDDRFYKIETGSSFEYLDEDPTDTLGATYTAVDGYLERMSVFGSHYVASGSVNLRDVTSDDFGTDYKLPSQRDYLNATKHDGQIRLGLSALSGMNSLKNAAQNHSDWLLPSATNISDTGWVTNNPAVFSEMASTGGLVGVYASTKDLMSVGGGKNSFMNEIIGSMNNSLGTNYYATAFGAGGRNPTGFAFSLFDEYTQAVFGDTAQYSQTSDAIMASGLRGRYILPLLDGKISRLSDAVRGWEEKRDVSYKGLEIEIETDMVKFSGISSGETDLAFDKFLNWGDGVISDVSTNDVTLTMRATDTITLYYHFPGYYVRAKVNAVCNWDNIKTTLDISTNVTGYVEIANLSLAGFTAAGHIFYNGENIGVVTLEQDGDDALGYIYGKFTLGRERTEASLSRLVTYSDDSEIAQSRLINAVKSVESFSPVHETLVHQISTGGDLWQYFTETNDYIRARSSPAQSGTKAVVESSVLDTVAFLQGRMLEVEEQAGELPDVTTEELEEMFGIYNRVVGGRKKALNMMPSVRSPRLRVMLTDGEISGPFEGIGEDGEWYQLDMPIYSSAMTLDGFTEASEEVTDRFVPDELKTLNMTYHPHIYLLERDFGFWNYKWRKQENQ